MDATTDEVTIAETSERIADGGRDIRTRWVNGISNRMKFGDQLQHDIPAIAAQDAGKRRGHAREDGFDHAGIRFDARQTECASELRVTRVGRGDSGADFCERRSRLL